MTQRYVSWEEELEDLLLLDPSEDSLLLCQSQFSAAIKQASQHIAAAASCQESQSETGYLCPFF
jgi:hypothetical protein